MNRGDVYEYTLGNARVRIVIVSAAPYNPRRATYAVVRGPDSTPPPVVVVAPMGDGDPVRGAVDLTQLRPLIVDNLGARIGRLSRTTMRAVDDGLRVYLGL